jgi:hypothetical protein
MLIVMPQCNIRFQRTKREQTASSETSRLVRRGEPRNAQSIAWLIFGTYQDSSRPCARHVRAL